MRPVPSNKIKILYLFSHLHYGGAEVGLLTNLKYIDKEHFECSVVCIEKKDVVGDEIEKLGFKVTYLNSSSRLYNFININKILRILKIERPDILHTSLFYANFFGRVASLLHRPIVVITEERSMYTEKRFYHCLIDKILSRFTDRIIVCSNSVLDFTVKQQGINRDKFYMIYNVVDTQRFNISETKEQLREEYGIPQTDFIVGTVGSLLPVKAHEYLIKATKEISKAIGELKVYIVGKGRRQKELSDLAESLDVKEKVLFFGTRKDIPQLMKIMDIFVLTSVQEGFPRVLIEAMYLGLPVVVPNISGIPEVVVDGENGYLFESRNLKAMVDKILALYNDTNLRNKLGSSAKRKIESVFIPDYYLDRLEGLYFELAKLKTKDNKYRIGNL